MKAFLAYISPIPHLIFSLDEVKGNVSEKAIELYKGLEPVYYRNIDVGVTEILEVETKFMMGLL